MLTAMGPVWRILAKALQQVMREHGGGGAAQGCMTLTQTMLAWGCRLVPNIVDAPAGYGNFRCPQKRDGLRGAHPVTLRLFD